MMSLKETGDTGETKESTETDEIYRALRQQADEMLVGDAMNKVLAIAFDDNNKNNLQALKFIIDGKTAKTKEKVGRPKKEKKEPEIDAKDLLADIKRLNQGLPIEKRLSE